MIASRCSKCESIGTCGCNFPVLGIGTPQKKIVIDKDIVDFLDKYRHFKSKKLFQTCENKFYAHTEFKVKEISVQENIGYFKPLDIQHYGSVEFIIFESYSGNLFQKYYKNLYEFMEDFEPITGIVKRNFNLFGYKIIIINLESK